MAKKCNALKLIGKIDYDDIIDFKAVWDYECMIGNPPKYDIYFSSGYIMEDVRVNDPKLIEKFREIVKKYRS